MFEQLYVYTACATGPGVDHCMHCMCYWTRCGPLYALHVLLDQVRTIVYTVCVTGPGVDHCIYCMCYWSRCGPSYILHVLLVQVCTIVYTASATGPGVDHCIYCIVTGPGVDHCIYCMCYWSRCGPLYILHALLVKVWTIVYRHVLLVQEWTIAYTACATGPGVAVSSSEALLTSRVTLFLSTSALFL